MSTVVVVILHLFFFFNDTATTEIYTLSLHDALPILAAEPIPRRLVPGRPRAAGRRMRGDQARHAGPRSEEHTSELQSLAYLVCRLLLEKKKKHELVGPAARLQHSQVHLHSPRHHADA